MLTIDKLFSWIVMFCSLALTVLVIVIAIQLVIQ